MFHIGKSAEKPYFNGFLLHTLKTTDKEKSERLNALNIELNLDKKDPAVLDAEPEQTEEQPEKNVQIVSDKGICRFVLLYFGRYNRAVKRKSEVVR